ncbi:MAG: hypothetical protein AB200_01985 [Parcubacteria bacterium C7867-005]|nr:MAG: hypothetical protein AB200_01985 [Parcubacteria bacterium C7867-005]
MFLVVLGRVDDEVESILLPDRTGIQISIPQLIVIIPFQDGGEDLVERLAGVIKYPSRRPNTRRAHQEDLEGMWHEEMRQTPIADHVVVLCEFLDHHVAHQVMPIFWVLTVMLCESLDARKAELFGLGPHDRTTTDETIWEPHEPLPQGGDEGGRSYSRLAGDGELIQVAQGCILGRVVVYCLRVD